MAHLISKLNSAKRRCCKFFRASFVGAEEQYNNSFVFIKGKEQSEALLALSFMFLSCYDTKDDETCCDHPSSISRSELSLMSRQEGA